MPTAMCQQSRSTAADPQQQQTPLLTSVLPTPLCPISRVELLSPGVVAVLLSMASRDWAAVCSCGRSCMLAASALRGLIRRCVMMLWGSSGTCISRGHELGFKEQDLAASAHSNAGAGRAQDPASLTSLQQCDPETH